ncbi:MAG: hypothetical protein QG567_1071 [Campylobacterota bacterium]|nr:hypothetical protein [Candidatus Poribacteria bacterium]MDQ1339915.1 hypothetical protein [Campylobacterota bacterium]
MEIFATIITGVFVFVLGQMILKLFLEPLQELQKIQRQLIEDVSFYANIYYNSTIDTPEFRNKVYETSDILRKNAVKLNAIVLTIPLYKYLEKLNIVTKKSDISTIQSRLIGISNLMTGKKENMDFKMIHEWAKEIELILKMRDK